jgi:hypothetical protein
MAEWWETLPPAQTEVGCGDGRHVIRWEGGTLTLPAHTDAEAELVLAALGGAKAACVELAETWGRHAGDLDVLALGPRWAGDEIPVAWEDVESTRAERPAPFLRPRSMPMIGRPGGGAAGSGAARTMGGPAGGGVRSGRITAGAGAGAGGAGAVAARIDVAWSRHMELLSLLALGPAFQLRLAATVAASWQETIAASWQERPAGEVRPALAAALTGRLAPAAQAWLGIDPDRVTARPHDGPGWGSLELGPAEGRTSVGHHLRASLPIGWLAGVWAGGLAVVGGHLVVAVQAARWPDAQVLAVPEPGADPVTLHVRAAPPGPERSGDGAHWVVTDTGEEAVST